MTENEANTILKAEIAHHPECSIFAEALGLAIQALEEVQQYCTIGTLEELQDMKKAGNDAENNPRKEAYLKALEDYHRLISEECKFMLIKCNPYALHLKEYNDKVLEQLKAGGNY